MKVIILCGGYGTRLREETEYKPKPMVEIGGKPILWHIMKIYSHFGFNDFVLALGYKGEVIRNYFFNYDIYNNDFTVELGKNKNLKFHEYKNPDNWRVTLVNTGDDTMTGYRVKKCSEYIKDDYFMLTYGDAVANVDINKLIAFHKKQKTIGTVTGVYPPSRFGDLVTKGNKVINFKEKLKDVENQVPVNGGFFVFSREFFDLIPDNKDCDLEREPMSKLTLNSQLSYFRHTGFWQCMDTYRDFLLLNKLWNNNPPWKIWN